MPDTLRDVGESRGLSDGPALPEGLLRSRGCSAPVDMFVGVAAGDSC
jgi:hypothetical protein